MRCYKMVRVNLVNPKILTDEHLYAENVELDMLLTFVNKYPEGFVPEDYTLGKGHVSFFRNKIKFINYRKALIQAEIKRRKGLPIEVGLIMEVEWLPMQKDININQKRIIERLKNPKNKKNNWHYAKQKIKDINKFINENYYNIYVN